MAKAIHISHFDSITTRLQAKKWDAAIRELEAMQAAGQASVDVHTRLP